MEALRKMRTAHDSKRFGRLQNFDLAQQNIPKVPIDLALRLHAIQTRHSQRRTYSASMRTVENPIHVGEVIRSASMCTIKNPIQVGEVIRRQSHLKPLSDHKTIAI